MTIPKMKINLPYANLGARAAQLRIKAARGARETADLVNTAYVWTASITFTIFMGLWAIPVAVFGVEDKAHDIARVWGKGLVRIARARIRVFGREKVHQDGPVIYLANHLSIVDIPVFYQFLTTQFRWISKASLFKVPIIGTVMKGAGYISVDRADRRNAMESLFQAAKRISQGSSVIIFPEGTVGPHDGRLLPFKKGSFILAKKSRVVLQPVTLWGTQHIMPDKQERLLNRVFKNDVDVIVHDPILPEQYEDLSAEELSKMVHDILSKSLEPYIEAGRAAVEKSA